MTPRGSTIAKFLFASMFICGIIATLLTGCGGSNNPSGPTPAVSDPVSSALEAGTFSIVGKVVADNLSPIGDISVKLFAQHLTGALFDSGRSYLTLTSGEFTFSNLGTGTFVIKIEENSKFLESSRLAIIDGSSSVSSIDVGDVIVLAKANLDPLVPTLDIKGKVSSSLTASPLSVAQITLDTGYSTVSNGFGIFELKNVEAGNRRITINQPSISSYTVSFVVNGTNPPHAESILLNNQTFAVNVGSRTVDLTLHNFVFQINPNLHHSGSLIGTVKQYDDISSHTLAAYEGYQFDLWGINVQGNDIGKFGTVRSGLGGTWRVDNLPPYEDNSRLWYAVPANTTVNIIPSDGGNVLVFDNLKWDSGEPKLASGYKVVAGKTTVMDFTVPYFVTASPGAPLPPIIASIEDSTGTEVTASFIAEALDIVWTQNLPNKNFTAEFIRLYKDAATPEVVLTISKADTAPGSSRFRPSEIGLDFGVYSWRTKVIDPSTNSIQTVSDTKLLTIRPSNTDVTPQHGTRVLISPATYNITLAAPYDSEATSTVLELYSPSGALIPHSSVQNTSNSASYQLTWGPNTPTAGTYSWRVVYLYPDGKTMTSEPATLIFE